MELTRREFMKAGVAAAGVLAASGSVLAADHSSSGPFPGHAPEGKGQGIFPGRVVWTHNPAVVNWDGVDFWWRPANFNETLLLDLINSGLMELSGKGSPAQAWQAVFEWRNRKNGRQGAYVKGQKIAIKTNMNGAGEYNDDPRGRISSPYGNPVTLKTLLKSLVESGGVEPRDITVFDTCRIFPDYMREMCSEGNLAGINFRQRDPFGPLDAKADQKASINWSGPIRGQKTYMPECLTEATYLINLANLKGHSWGLTLTAKNHFGSFVNSDRRRTPAAAGLHPNIIEAARGDYSALVDLMLNPHINDKTILWMLDAIITAPSETGAISPSNSRWQMEPFNGNYAASMFLSLDPVAIDSVGADFLVNEPVMIRFNPGMGDNKGMENYLHEAANLPSPPSGTAYRGACESLGVHEHWNNAKEKRYSGNNKPGTGIELVYKRLGE